MRRSSEESGAPGTEPGWLLHLLLRHRRRVLVDLLGSHRVLERPAPGARGPELRAWHSGVALVRTRSWSTVPVAATTTRMVIASRYRITSPTSPASVS